MNHVVMKGLFITLAILSIGSLFAQEAPRLSLPTGVEVQNATPQQLADAVSKAVKENPQQATMLVRQVMGAINNFEGKFSEIEKKRAAAIISAAVAAAPGLNRSTIIAAGAGAVPALGGVVLQAANAVPTEKTSPAEGDSPKGMLLGNIRVQEVLGKGVKLVDANGKTSNLKEGEFLRQGVRIVTGPEGSAVLIFENGSLVRVNADSEFSIENFQQDPFEAEVLDHSAMEGEPSRSLTRTGVIKGEISFDVAKLKKKSQFDFVTPVGVCGIRGTGGFVKSTPKNQSQAASFGLFEGSATFTTPSGQTQTVNQNQAIGIGGVGNNFGINMNPPGSTTSLSQASQGMSQARTETSGNAFQGAPPPQAAPAGPLSSLTPAQQQAIQQAAAQGAEAVAEAALQLAMQSPEAAADIAAAAVDVAPALAATIATTFSSTFPDQAAGISASVSSVIPVQSSSIASAIAIAMPSQAAAVAAAVSAVTPSEAAQVASAVAIAAPAQATAVAAAVSTSVPSQATTIASTVAAAVPAQAAAIAAAVAGAAPSQAAAIASAVAAVVPSEAAAIATSVGNAIPAQASAIAAAVAASAPSESGATGGAFSTIDSSQSNGILNVEEDPSPLIPEPSPEPSATPAPPTTTPTPPPVSPSA
jgi:hypothetical protein